MTRPLAPSVAVRTVSRPAATSTNIVLIGPPGAGKGTQAAGLARALRVPTISTGEMLRRAVQSGSALGLAVKAAMDRGDLVDDAMMTDLVAARLAEPDTRSGFVLDGFPRTVDQAVSLDGLLQHRGSLVVVELTVPDGAIIRRLSERRVCAQCGRNADPDAGRKPSTICACGGALRQRSDDAEAVVRDRLRTYERSTRPLIDFYRQRRALRAIDGTQPPDLVRAEIARVIDAVFDHATN